MHYYNYNEASDELNTECLTKAFRENLISNNRQNLCIPPRGELDTGKSYGIWMPLYSPDEGIYMVKSGMVQKERHPGVETVSSIITVYDSNNNIPLFSIDGAAIINARTAALSAVAIWSCTDDTYVRAAVIGSGTQAKHQISALATKDSITEVRVYSRNPETLHDIATTQSHRFNIIACDTIEKATQEADIVCTATTSNIPLNIELKNNGRYHINCIGAHSIQSREIHQDIIDKSTLVVESVELNEAMSGSNHSKVLEMEDAVQQAGLADTPTVFSSYGHAYYDFLAIKYFMSSKGITHESFHRRS